MEENLHKGHRQRAIKEFLNGGFDNMPEHKILEILLFYCVLRTDTNPLAHALIKRFGSIAGVLDAPIEELEKFSGLSKRGAALLKMIIPVSKIYADKKAGSEPHFSSREDIGNFLLNKFLGLTEEKVAVIFSNAGGRLIDFCFLSDGDVGSVGVSIKSILKLCLQKNSTVIILCHNHPSGIALPSANDIVITEKLASALKAVDINLFDHIIISGGDYVSLSQSKEYSHIFK